MDPKQYVSTWLALSKSAFQQGCGCGKPILMYEVRPESHVLAGLLGPGSVARARHCSGWRKEQPVASILWEAKARPRPIRV